MQPDNSHTDNELIDLIKEGNAAAFRALYDRYGEILYDFAYNILQDKDECADVVQDILYGYGTSGPSWR